jgi:hypothetical protein
MGLRLLGWVREVSSGEEKEPILYSISGLSPDDNCIVGYAGIGWDGKRKWYLHWYRSGKQLPTPDVAYDSPEEALKAATELKEKGI